jgi:cytochrome c biogenesis protein CcdA/glutaredoxin
VNRIASLLTLLLICGGFLLPVAQAEEPVVRAVLFWSTTCPHCHVVIDETLPPLQAKYGDRLQIELIETSDPASYELYRAAVEAYSGPPDRQGVPALFIGDHHLVGSVEIPRILPGLIEEYLAADGVDYPDIPGLVVGPKLTPTHAASPTPRPTPTTKACHICEEEPPPTREPVVHFWLFYDSHCGSCLTLLEDILPPILAKYEAGQVVVHQNDLEKGGYELMRALEKQHGLEYGDVPEIFIGDQVLLGNEEIQARLEPLIDKYLAQGGVALPEVELTPTPIPTAAAYAPPTIHLAYFYQPGCRECDLVQMDLDYLQHHYPQLLVHAFDVKAEAALAEWLGERAGVPEERRLTAPAVFVGDEGLVGEELHARSLEALIARHAPMGAEAVWKGWEASQSEAAGSIIERFRSFGLLTVLAAGLVDGLNPCAFATIVFFISYLAFVDRKGREVLAVGAAFALGVFLTYLGVGVGLLKSLASLPFLDALSRWVYGLTAALCLFLALGSLYDWWQARRGKPEEMRLKLPARLRRWINRVIRDGAGPALSGAEGVRAFVPVAFVTGAAISVIELACTGQIYLPTILFVLGVPGLRVRAGLYLLLYNLMFVLPLVVVFLLAYFGTTSQQLARFINRRAGTIKLVTAGLFVLLAGWLVTALL